MNSSISDEALDSFRRSIEVDRDETSSIRYSPDDVLAILDIHLKVARRRAREEQKKYAKSLEEGYTWMLQGKDPMKEAIALRRDLEAREIK